MSRSSSGICFIQDIIEAHLVQQGRTKHVQKSCGWQNETVSSNVFVKYRNKLADSTARNVISQYWSGADVGVYSSKELKIVCGVLGLIRMKPLLF